MHLKWAEQVAREAHQYSMTVDLAGATGVGERGATSSGGSDTSEEAEQPALGYVGLIHQRTQLPHQQILADIGVPDVILAFVQDYPANETSQGARREIVRLAKEKYGIDEREGEEALNRMLPKEERFGLLVDRELTERENRRLTTRFAPGEAAPDRLHRRYRLSASAGLG